MFSQPRLLYGPESKWPQLATNAIRSAVHDYLSKQGNCSVMLTGGNTAERLYRYWAEDSPWDHAGVHYFFGDERCVAPDHADSNYGMVLHTLFKSSLPSTVKIFRMEAELSNREVAILRYQNKLPKSVDVLLLGMGPDGHIASLFPGNKSLREMSSSIVLTDGPKYSSQRLTITPGVIETAKSIFLLVIGKAKGEVLATALTQPEDIESLPVRLALNATWIMDDGAAAPVIQAIKRISPSRYNRSTVQTE